MRLRIEKLVPGGLGLAHTPEGVALVRGGLPGTSFSILSRIWVTLDEVSGKGQHPPERLLC
ncbi:hypothetical protein Mrose_03258 [Calidithermus roseus]|uniref:Uncharacterized protein n=1 Tax=Calidithermus roseus TaxID=1644118 RepID=A0A399EKV7_9DEIN|nr:hypothetical protein Mrose_03258 [Calidithermus roseus]